MDDSSVEQICRGQCVSACVIREIDVQESMSTPCSCVSSHNHASIHTLAGLQTDKLGHM